MNIARGILEAQEVTYKHLNKLLRPIPLNTPTEIELTPIKKIRVTLIDANHCPGSVMFLIEGDNKTILYTGDIRAEKWWVDSLIRNPFLIPYTLGGKRLDNLYLDTTYLYHAGVPPETFCSKAEGIAELLKRVQSFPPDTVFHLGAWTFGYEEVWLTLAAALRTKVHPDAYQLALYQSLGQANRGVDESAAYNGFRLGNDIVPGCLTNDICGARIHLCAPPCIIACQPKTVYLRPFLGRGNDGFEMCDMGAGGGSGDVYQRHELDFIAGMNALHLVKYCLKRMNSHSQQQKLTFEWRMLRDLQNNGGKLSISKYGILLDSDMRFDHFADLLVANVLKYDQNMAVENRANVTGNPRRTVIRFPYARHSSYSELCHFISVFKPKDIHACVVDNRDVSGGRELVDEFFDHLLTDQPGYSRRLQQQKKQVQEAEQAWAAEVEVREERQEAGYPEPAFLEERNEDPASYESLSGMSYELLRELNEKWLLFADVEHDFSSIAAEQETRMTSKLLGLVDLPTPGAVKEKRDEIRRAQEYLQDQTDPAEMQVGPLPPTWSGGLDGPADSRNPKPKTAQRTSPKPKHAKTEATKEVKDSPPARAPRGHWTRVMVHRNEAGVAQIQAASSSNVQSPPAQQSQISVPESDLAPSVGSASSTSLTRERLEELNNMHRLDGSASVQLEARIEAYLAAFEDKFSAWTGMLTSAGDNHGEEEMEL
ncbi:5' exonuclease Apollo [Penicillium subrubescens]|uniref:Protein artemis n=2 Tax=Penicillium subrubescens TaxID=1316194 RepID=A0A1Q5UJ97_9EURO|nr:5' exonuclease Apollo [Penicillium subrubescens]